jgi:hypothetical protein
MNTIGARLAYRLLLRLHPASFQHEFGAEMLWIFDEEQQQGSTVYLFFDGVRSLLRQRCRSQKDPGQLSITSGTIISSPGIGMLRLFQGSLLCLAIFFSLSQLLRHPSPFSPSVKWSDRMSCYMLTLQAPSHAEVVLNPLP